MAPRQIDEGSTEFGIAGSRTPFSGSWFFPTGRLGRWFARFFPSKFQTWQRLEGEPGQTPMHPLAGDTVVNRDVITGDGYGMGVIRGARSPVLPELELNRRNRYRS